MRKKLLLWRKSGITCGTDGVIMWLMSRKQFFAMKITNGGIVHQPMFLVCTDRNDLLRLKCSDRLKIVARKNQEKQLKENQMIKLRQLEVTKLKHLSHP